MTKKYLDKLDLRAKIDMRSGGQKTGFLSFREGCDLEKAVAELHNKIPGLQLNGDPATTMTYVIEHAQYLDTIAQYDYVKNIEGEKKRTFS